MKKTLLASLLALSFVGSAQAAVVNFNNGTNILQTLNMFDTIGFGTIVVNSGGVNAIGFNLVSNTDYLNGAIWTTTTNNVGVGPNVQAQVFAESTNDTVFDDVLDTSLFSFTVTGSAQVATFLNAPSGTYYLKFTNNSNTTAFVNTSVEAVPVPAAAWLFGSALFGAGALRRKLKTA